MEQRKKIFLFGTYSYILNTFYLIIDFLPPFVRQIIFKLTLGSYGELSFIDYRTYLRYPKKIFIGNRVMINRGCTLLPTYFIKDASIYIGNNVAIGPDVNFFAGGHDYSVLELPVTAGSINIGDHVWIGGKSIILPGVTIGQGTIIGAGSVVTKDIPSWSIAVGNPAKVIKKRKLLSKEVTCSDTL